MPKFTNRGQNNRRKEVKTRRRRKKCHISHSHKGADNLSVDKNAIDDFDIWTMIFVPSYFLYSYINRKNLMRHRKPITEALRGYNGLTKDRRATKEALVG